jgi:hypothetical protein
MIIFTVIEFLLFHNRSYPNEFFFLLLLKKGGKADPSFFNLFKHQHTFIVKKEYLTLKTQIRPG